MSNNHNSKLLPNEHYMLLGMIITQYGRIENLIEQVIWRLLDMDFAEGRLITSSMSFHPRWKLLTNLVRAKIQNKRFIEELKKIEKPIKSAFDERTILVHGVWFMQDEKACVSLTKQKTQKADHVRLHIYERDDLETLANQLAKIGDFLQLLNTDLESNNLS